METVSGFIVETVYYSSSQCWILLILHHPRVLQWS